MSGRIDLPGKWARDAKCNGQNIDDFDADNLPGKGRTRDQAAKKLCEGCPVIPQCADLAYRTRATGYVFAGIALYKQPEANESKWAQLRAIAVKGGIRHENQRAARPRTFRESSPTREDRDQET